MKKTAYVLAVALLLIFSASTASASTLSSTVSKLQAQVSALQALFQKYLPNQMAAVAKILSTTPPSTASAASVTFVSSTATVYDPNSNVSGDSVGKYTLDFDVAANGNMTIPLTASRGTTTMATVNYVMEDAYGNPPVITGTTTASVSHVSGGSESSDGSAVTLIGGQSARFELSTSFAPPISGQYRVRIVIVLGNGLWSNEDFHTSYADIEGAVADPESSNLSACNSGESYIFNTNLSVGSTLSSEVHKLQCFLNSRGFLTGNYLSGYFGSHTQGALTVLQVAAGIAPANGVLNPITRAYINSLSGGTTATPTITVVSPKGGERYTTNDSIPVNYFVQNISKSAKLDVYLYNPDAGNVANNVFVGPASGTGSSTGFFALSKIANLKSGNYKINICDEATNNPSAPGKPLCGISLNYFTIQREHFSLPPVVSIIGTPTLKLTLDSKKKESSLVGTFQTKVTAGSEDMSFYASYFNIEVTGGKDANNIKGTINTADFGNLPSHYTSVNGDKVYTLAAGKSATITFTKTMNPQYLFAGSYTESLKEISPFDASGVNKLPILSVPSNVTNAVTVVGEGIKYDFGGFYGQAKNPYATDGKCPAGYSASAFIGTSGVDNTAGFCYKTHADGVDPVADFGGLYTNATQCKGAQKLLGTSGVDNPLYGCASAHASGYSSGFGGLYSSGHTNPLAGNTLSCASGFSKKQVYGTPGVDSAVTLCSK